MHLYQLKVARIAGLLLFTSALAYCTSLRADQQPNVVFILADDLGWSDTTLYGTTALYKTPNIERLAARGMTFTHAYADSPLCSPTRASVLTGQSPARHGITTPNCHLPAIRLNAVASELGPASQKATMPQTVTRLSTKYYTLAEMFKDNGYATGHFGKWHLGAEPFSPLDHGFDVDVPHHPGPGPAGSYVAPWKFADFDHDPGIPNQHLEDRMAIEAVAFLESHRDEPFFLNYWMFSVHAPFDAKEALIGKYRKLISSGDPQRCPTYAAMIESMDDAVGSLLDTLDRLEIADNTIIIFASDNGGNMYNEVDGTTATNNAPLRGGKATMYEGGVRGPAIIVYPGQVSPASRSDEPIQTSDYYPTILDLLNIKAQAGQVFDGISLLPALAGGKLDRDAIFTYFPHSPPIPEWLPPSVSVHAGDWKMIRVFFGGENGRHSYKLFDLASDIGERRDLAAEQVERVGALDALIDDFLDDTNAVLPLPNPSFDPTKYDASRIGKGKLKSTGSNKKQPRRRPRVAGWTPGGTCDLALEGGAIVVTSHGGDPYLSFSLPAPVVADSMVLKFTLIAEAAGDGQVFWREQGAVPAFSRERSTPFAVQHDGLLHEYSAHWVANEPVVAVRIDPASGKGRVILSQIQLTDGSGVELYKWKD